MKIIRNPKVTEPQKPGGILSENASILNINVTMSVPKTPHAQKENPRLLFFKTSVRNDVIREIAINFI